MEVFLDDLAGSSNKENHENYLEIYFDKYMEVGLLINVAKSIILILVGRLIKTHYIKTKDSH